MAANERNEFDGGEVADRFRSLVTRNIQDNVKLMGRLADVMRVAADKARQSPGRPRDMMSTWLNMNVELCSLVNEQSLSFLNQALNLVEGSLGIERETAHGAVPEPAAPVELQLEGAPGETVQTAFQVENCHTHPADVTLECHAPATGIAIPESAVKAAALRLEGGAKGIAQIEVRIARSWKPGQSRSCLVGVTGFEAPPIVLKLKVRPPREAKPSRSAKKKAGAAPRKKRAKAAPAKQATKKKKA